MIEYINLILSALKSPRIHLLTSALIESIRKSNKWQDGIINVSAKISQNQRELLVLMAQVIENKLNSLSYSGQTISAFNSVFQELIDNALHHGVLNAHDHAKFTIVISDVFISLQVENAAGVEIPRGLIDGISERKTQLLDGTSTSVVGGRGLVMALDLSDTLIQTSNREIKAVLYRESLRTKHRRFTKVYISKGSPSA